MARKNIAVSDLRERVNRMIEATKPEMAKERQALMSMLESVLHDTGNYRGFNYLDSPFVNGVTDETRVHYY